MTAVTAITTITATFATTAATTTFTIPSFPMFLPTFLFARLFLVFTFPRRRRRTPGTAAGTRAPGTSSTVTVFILFFSFTRFFLVLAPLGLTRAATSAATSAEILFLFNFFIMTVPILLFSFRRRSRS